MNALTFNNITFSPVPQNDGQIWITSSELAIALGYAEADSVTRIFNRNSNEFTNSMTQTVNLTASAKVKGLIAKTRIFSLRGCHLIAMFARTAIAKQFRIWVLDILDRETKSTSYDRTPLRQACDRLAVGNMLISDAYRLVAERYQVEHIDQIPLDKLAEATAFVYQTILHLQSTTTPAINDIETLKNLVERVCTTRAWFIAIKEPLSILNPNLTEEITKIIAGATYSAEVLNKSLGLGIDVKEIVSTDWRARINLNNYQ